MRHQTRQRWIRRVNSLPKGLSLRQATKHLAKPYGATRYWLQSLGYNYIDGRKLCWNEVRRNGIRKIDPDTIDWSKSNVVISRELKVSRERIRQLRKLIT